MNYIGQLKEQIAERDARLAVLETSLSEITALLHSPKFTGTESNGERKDWIATADVLNWIRETRTQAFIRLTH